MFAPCVTSASSTGLGILKDLSKMCPSFLGDGDVSYEFIILQACGRLRTLVVVGTPAPALPVPSSHEKLFLNEQVLPGREGDFPQRL